MLQDWFEVHIEAASFPFQQHKSFVTIVECIPAVAIKLLHIHFNHLLQNPNRLLYYTPLYRLHKIQSHHEKPAFPGM